MGRNFKNNCDNMTLYFKTKEGIIMRLFKRKILSIICSMGLILGLLMINSMPARAEDLPEDGGSMARAIKMTDGKVYTKTWAKRSQAKHYSTFTISERGYITLDITKPYDDDYNFVRLYLKIFNDKDEMVFDSRTDGDTTASLSTVLNLGLDPGTYYIEMYPATQETVPITTNYGLKFTQSVNWEVEPNGSKDYATNVELGKKYSAIISGGEDNFTRSDYFKFEVTSPNSSYKISIGNYKRLLNSEKVQIGIVNPDGDKKYLDGEFTYEGNDGTAYYLVEEPEVGDWYLRVWASDGMFAYNYIESLPYSITVQKIENPLTVSYRTHVQSFGWQGFVSDGVMSGTSGLGKRLEGIEIKVDSGKDLGIRYKTHVQSYGWQSWKYDGAMSGTSGEAKRLEAICIELTGDDKDKYDVYYRVHAQSYGWLGWAKNGQPAGTAGQGKRLEGIEIKVLPKGQLPGGTVGYSYIEVGKSADNSKSAGMVNYMTHVQSYGNQSYVFDGSVSGTFGEAKRLEGIKINVNTNKTGVSGGISYRTHVQTYGWLGWSSNGAFNGTSGEGKRLEAIQIKLTGEMANKYDVYYRVHAQSFGWLGWAKNGQSAGTAGYAKRLEGIQIVLLPKGSSAPSALPGTPGTASFIQK